MSWLAIQGVRTYPTTRLPPRWTACERSPMRPMPPPPYTRSMPLDTCIACVHHRPPPLRS